MDRLVLHPVGFGHGGAASVGRILGGVFRRGSLVGGLGFLDQGFRCLMFFKVVFWALVFLVCSGLG